MSNLPTIDINNDPPNSYSNTNEAGLSLDGAEFTSTHMLHKDLPELHIPLDSNDPFVKVPDCSYFSESQLVSVSRSQPNDLFFAHLNVRSLNKNFDQLRDFLNELKFNSSVIGVSETWLKDTPSPLFSVEGFSLFTNNRTEKRGGGVGFYVSDNLKAKVIEELSIKSEDIEAIFIDMYVPDQKNFVVGEIYRPPNSSPSKFLEAIQSILSAASLVDKRIVVMGDYNLNLMHCNDNAHCQHFLDLLLSHSLTPLIRKPTRVTDTTFTLIDNIFVDNISNTRTGIIVSDISDHYPIFAIIPNDKTKLHKYDRSGIRDLSQNNINKLKEKLNSLNWSEVFDAENVDLSYRAFIDTLLLHYNTTIPLQKPTRSNYRKIPRSPWINKTLLKCINRKNTLFHKYKHNPTPGNKLKYARYRNILTNSLRTAKKIYFTKQFAIYKDDAKNTWKIINSVINPTPKHESVEKVNVDNAQLKEPSEISEAFNNFFVNIGPNLASSIPNSHKPFHHYLNNKNASSLFFDPVVEEEVKDIVNNLNTKKASGFDGITNFLLKNLVDEIISPLTYILNMSLLKGVVPDRMKIAKVIPIFKKGNKEELGNYRPISLLTSLSKILERLVYSRTLKFFNEFNIFSNSQFGFRKKHSTSHALLTFINKMANATDDQLYTIGIFLDLSKAFDTIDHDILLYKLSYYGIRGKALDWFRSYLTNRKQFVAVNGHESMSKHISCGVPQGSLLGPLLFILYINDFPNSSSLLSFILFADDSNIFFSHCNPQTLLDTVNNELKFVQDWIYANKLSLNIAKTQYMVFKNNQINPLPGHVTINNVDLQKTECTKFLGLYIDNDLSWKSHINHLCKILSRNTGILYKLKDFFPSNILKTLYGTLINSYIYYGILAWGNSTSFLLERILNIQKRAIRIVNQKPFLAHTNELFLSNKVFKISDLFLFNVGIFMYKLSTNDLPGVFSTLFMRNEDFHSYPTRQSHSYHLPRTRTVFAQKTIKYNGPKFWNELPSEVITSPSLHVFKNKLKCFLLQKYNS